MQSTDFHAFSPTHAIALRPKQNSEVAFGAVSASKSGLTTQEVRDKSLAGVKDRQANRETGGRMKGKVGIITGVGPVAGIGVSDEHQFEGVTLM
jgi:hypothetical protein